MDTQVADSASTAVVRREVAVVGASAGGVEALIAIARGLPADVALSVVVVLHMPAGANSRLPDILGRSGPLRAVFAEHGATPERGVIHVAPPDNHLVFSGERMYLLDGARENGFRPAIDPLFRTAARHLGPRAIGVILTGTMDDGAAGLAAIKSFGGATVVQDPADALAAGMPRAAIEAATPDHILALPEIPRLLSALAGTVVDARTGNGVPSLRAVGPGRDLAPLDPTLVADPMELPPHGVDMACPECGGALQEIAAGPISRFRCRTGHIYSPGTLLDHKAIELEGALWAALRALEEEASLAGRLVAKSRDAGADAAARRFERRQGDAAGRADLVRQALHDIGNDADGGPEPVMAGQPGVAST